MEATKMSSAPTRHEVTEWSASAKDVLACDRCDREIKDRNRRMLIEECGEDQLSTGDPYAGWADDVMESMQ